MTDKEVDEIYNSRYNYLYKLLQKRERELAKEHPMCGTLYKFTYSDNTKVFEKIYRDGIIPENCKKKTITILADSERDASRILHIISPYSHVLKLKLLRAEKFKLASFQIL